MWGKVISLMYGRGGATWCRAGGVTINRFQLDTRYWIRYHMSSMYCMEQFTLGRIKNKVVSRPEVFKI